MKHAQPQAPRTSTRTKALVAGGLIALTAAGVGGAAFAAFTGTTNAQQSVDSGSVSLAGIGVDGPGNRLSIGASNIAAGDTIQREVTLTNTGSIALKDVKLTTTAVAPTSLLTGATGLTMAIDSCPSGWTESSTPYTYTCGSTPTTVLATRAVIGSDLALSNLDLTANTPNHLRVTLTLPAGADNTFQSQSSTIDYLFVGTQRDATNK